MQEKELRTVTYNIATVFLVSDFSCASGLRIWRVISVKIMFVLMFWIYTGIKISVITLMRWHMELKRDITEYVLTLRPLSWNYDVRLDIMMLIFIYITKQ